MLNTDHFSRNILKLYQSLLKSIILYQTLNFTIIFKTFDNHTKSVRKEIIKNTDLLLLN
jgi:hypothetical protein